MGTSIGTQFGDTLLKGFTILRSLQGNKTASILRYVEADAGSPEIGEAPTQVLVAGLANLDVFEGKISVREVMASQGRLELSDVMFIFWVEVLATDLISYEDKTYRIVQTQYYDSVTGQCQVIGRAL